MRARTVLATSLLAALAGCAGCDTVPPDAVTDCNAQIVPGGAATDILFVIDDSGSMAGEQTELANNLAQFIDQLLGSAIALDVRIGVTNTSVADGSSDSAAEGPNTYTAGVFYGKPYPRGSLTAVLDPDSVVTPGLFAYDPVFYGSTTGGWGGQRVLSSGALSVADIKRFFRANVRQGTRGSGKEQPLRAMRLAIEKAQAANGDNFGFLRAGARLAVVIVTDEDDCSESAAPFLVGTGMSTDTVCHDPTNKRDELDPLSDFVTLLDTTVGGEPPIVAVVSGFDMNNLAPTGCDAGVPGGTSSADNPTRLDDFLQRLDATHPGRTFKDSICNDFGPSLTKIASKIIPQTLPLKQSPADYRMMVVSVIDASGAAVGCPMAAAGTPEASSPSTGVVYAPAPPGGYPTLTFQNACHLDLGDKIDIKILCAG